MDYSAVSDAQQYQYSSQQQPPTYDPAQQPPSSYAADPAAHYSSSHSHYAHPYASSAYSDPTLHPPGVSAAPETGAHHGAPHYAQDTGAHAYYEQDYYSHHPQQQQQQRLESSPVPPGLNPAAAAAVAALSQLQQFAERAMAGEQERHWGPEDGGYSHYAGGLSHPYYGHHGAAQGFGPPPVRRPLYRGGGRRGGGSFRGGGRNNLVSHPYRPDSSNIRGRGRVGRGGGNRQIPNIGSAAPAPPTEYAAGPTAGEVSQITPPAEGEVKAPLRRPPQVSWCELCMVDCNSLEILEQHLNGKRHKKNVQRHQEFAKHKKLMAEMQQQPVLEQAHPQPQSQSQVLPQPQPQCDPDVKKEIDSAAAEEKKPSSAATEGIPIASFEEEVIKTEPEAQPQNQGGEELTEAKQEPATEVLGEDPSGKPFRSRGNWEDRRLGLKRGKTRYGRGAKRMRMSRDEFPPAKLREEPKFCALCNITCDTQAVFEVHLAGKKHASKLRRSQGSMGPYGHQPNRSLHPQPFAYVPSGQHQPIIYNNQGQGLVKEEAGAVQQGAHVAGSEPHTGENAGASQGQEIPSGSAVKEASWVANVQAETASNVGGNVQDAVITEANGQIPM